MGEDRTFDEIVGALREPDAYPWHPADVETIETHISWVFLAGDKVLKLKRPVNYGFVDYTTREQRRVACEDEVRLNRRLTRDVYLGVSRITRSANGITVDGDGEALEWATRMRRLPASGMLDHLLAQDELEQGVVDAIAARMIAFHRSAAEPCAGDIGTEERQAKVVLDNLQDLEPFAGAPLPETQLHIAVESVRSFRANASDLLRRRVAERWIREGHGDLRTDHICLDERGEIQIFDCVEFNKGIRCADVASDLAFLVVDLNRLGASETASHIVDRYRASQIDLPEPLLRFYQGHRALVKVKVACLSWRDLPPEHRQAFFAEAATYLDLAMAVVTTPNPCMIAMSGLSGTGKSVIAAALGRALGAPVLSSDAIRKELEADAESCAGWQTGRYQPGKRAAIYARLFERARETVQQGKPVILDATFLESVRRLEAAEAARSVTVPLFFVETVAGDDVVRERLKRRKVRGDSDSEATIEIYERQAAELAARPPVTPEGAMNIKVDTSVDGPVDLDKVYSALLKAGVLRAEIATD